MDNAKAHQLWFFTLRGRAGTRESQNLWVFFRLDRTPHESKHLNVVAREKSVAGMLKLARGQFPNNPVGWSNRQAEGRTVSNP
jgi:hypothetical protein